MLFKVFEWDCVVSVLLCVLLVCVRSGCVREVVAPAAPLPLPLPLDPELVVPQLIAGGATVDVVDTEGFVTPVEG